MMWIRVGLLAFVTLSMWVVRGIVVHSMTSQASLKVPGVQVGRPAINPAASSNHVVHDTADVTASIHASAKYLIHNTGNDGMFVYRRDVRSGHEPLPRYNLLRHAGTIYALAKYQSWQPDEPLVQALADSARFLQREAIRPVPGRDDLLAVWSDPEITNDDGPLQAKLGGAGLGLVALTSVERCQPDVTSIEDLRKLARFICVMQKEDGSFYSKFIPSEGGRSDKWTSLYYPGEAALGLLLLDELDPSREWIEAAAKALGYLARIRAGEMEVEADHWALLATAKLLKHCDEAPLSVTREQLIQHARQICESILAERPNFPANSPKHGCFTTDGRTCPTATRLEGLIVAYDFLPHDEVELRSEIKLSIQQGIGFLLRAQLQGGTCDGGLPREILPQPTGNQFSGTAFNDRATEVRIDYVQHAMCAMIDYLQLRMGSDHHVDRDPH